MWFLNEVHAPSTVWKYPSRVSNNCQVYLLIYVLLTPINAISKREAIFCLFGSVVGLFPGPGKLLVSGRWLSKHLMND